MMMTPPYIFQRRDIGLKRKKNTDVIIYKISRKLPLCLQIDVVLFLNYYSLSASLTNTIFNILKG